MRFDNTAAMLAIRVNYNNKERYTNLNAEFQRIARRDKKGFLSDQ